ncbi:MAG: type 4 pilus major pilin, partial [Alphaproteobacteria bacterium]
MMINSESGRSMVEMLGVLAIIGVMSVGGMAGYTKMMDQYKVSKAIQQIEQISSRLTAIGSGASSYEGLNNASAIKFDAIPLEAKEGSGSNLTNPFGGKIIIEAAPLLSASDLPAAGVVDRQAYTISYTDLPEAACADLGAHDWYGGKNTNLIGIGIVPAETQLGTVASLLYQGCDGDKTGGNLAACSNGATYSTPISITTTAAVCSC